MVCAAEPPGISTVPGTAAFLARVAIVAIRAADGVYRGNAVAITGSCFVMLAVNKRLYNL